VLLLNKEHDRDERRVCCCSATTYPLILPQRSTTIGVICSPHFGPREGQAQMLFLHKSYTRKALCFSTEYSFFLAVWSETECVMATGLTRQHM
jgi:hypothetical protein